MAGRADGANMAKPFIVAREDPDHPLEPDISYGISEQQFLDLDAKWTSFKESNCPDPPPENHGWKWSHKSATTGPYQFVTVKYAGEIQGILMISLAPVPARNPEAANQEVLYVEYLETAPWNQRAYAGANIRYWNIGTCLISEAIGISQRHRCDGRLGLHSLTQSRGFYHDQGFENLGYDSEVELDYFELSGKVLGNRGL